MEALIISGLVTGMLYAVAGLGIVVTYSTTKVLNFGLGGIGALSAYGASDALGWGLPYWAVIIFSLLVGAASGALIEIAVARPLQRRPPLTIALATLGVLLIFEGLIGLQYGYSARSLPQAFTGSGLALGSWQVSANQILILVMGVCAAAGLLVLLLRTRLGLSMRAVSSGPHTSELLGVSVRPVRLSGWVLGGLYGGLSAVLVTPLTYLSPTGYTAFLLTAIAAVVLGGFTNIVGVIVGAMAFGLATNVALAYIDPGLIATYSFIGVGLVLVLRPHGIFGKKEAEIAEPDLPPRPSVVRQRLGRVLRPQANTLLFARSSRVLPPWVMVTGAIGALVVFAVMPLVLDLQQVFVLSSALVTFIGIVGLSILVGHTGQVSLGHSGLLAVGAYAFAIGTQGGMPLVAGLIFATVLGALFGLLLGLPTTRLSGIYLTVLTLTFAFAVPELALHFEFTGGANGILISTPEFLAAEQNMYWFVLAISAAVGVATFLLGRGATGRKWHAVRDSEDGAQSIGLRPARVKLGAFVGGSALTGLSGALSVLMVGYVGPDSFGIFVAVYALLAVVLGGSVSIAGAFLGALFITLVPDLSGKAGVPQDLVFGLALILILFLAPTGIVGIGKRLLAFLPKSWFTGPSVDAVDMATTTASGSSSADADAEPIANRAMSASAPLLRLDSLSAGYKGGAVIRNVSMSIEAGEIVALLGTNGAGKSTVLRAISGVLAPMGGSIEWRGKVLHFSRTPSSTARLGIAHVPEGRGIFPDLTVLENLRMGTFGREGPPRIDNSILREIFTLFPVLEQRTQQDAGTLSGGEQQMLAIGRALISRPSLLILDEPSLGLSPLLSQQVFAALREIAASGVSILLVEQNARAALRLADRAYVIRRGQIVQEGRATEIAESGMLEQSYLGVGKNE